MSSHFSPHILPIHAADITLFHDECLISRAWTQEGKQVCPDGLWQFVELNHRFNNLVWDEEDRTRQHDATDSEIAASKRAMDEYRQKRHDTIEQMDKTILASFEAMVPRIGCHLNSETAGAMIDRLSILSLKIFHMNFQAKRANTSIEHITTCESRLESLREQRRDLANCLNTLLADCAAGHAYYKVYR